MKPTPRNLLIAGAVILGLAGTGAGVIHAANTATGSGHMTGLVSALAQKFNLNQADVQQVVEQHHQDMMVQHHQEMTQRLTERLVQAVKDGKLTQEQSDKILAKHQELEALHESLKGKTPEEMKTAMKAQMESLQQWATDNNIPKEFMFFGKMKMGPGHGRGEGRMFFHKEIRGQQGATNQ